jgi:protein-disulfide isomerase
MKFRNGPANRVSAAALAMCLALLLPVGAGSQAASGQGKALGKPNAPILIEMYSDFQCPHCKHLHETFLPGFIKAYVDTGKAYFVSREFPLQGFGPRSREAAAYATAAARIGKFQQVAHTLFQNQASWAASGKIWETVAAVLTPAEQAKVQVLFKDPAIAAEVQHDVDTGLNIPVTSTPTLVVTHRLQQRPWTYFDDGGNLFRGYMDELLKK